MQQVMAAAGRDVQVATAFRAVGFMTAHPASLAAPELVRRAARINGVADGELREYGLTADHGTPSAAETVLDRYIGLADRAVQDPSLLERELPSIFAPDATVQLADQPVTGFDAILEFYRAHIGAQADCKHYWTTTVLDDGTLEAHWVVAARLADGSLMTAGGVEHATVDSDGLITTLRNRFTRTPG
jgi:hypothetical protein